MDEEIGVCLKYYSCVPWKSFHWFMGPISSVEYQKSMQHPGVLGLVFKSLTWLTYKSTCNQSSAH